jgi:hypothetical protein
VKSTHMYLHSQPCPAVPRRACLHPRVACLSMACGGSRTHTLLLFHSQHSLHFPVTPSPGSCVGSRRSQTVGLSRVGRNPTIPKKGTHIVKQTDSLQSWVLKKPTCKRTRILLSMELAEKSPSPSQRSSATIPRLFSREVPEQKYEVVINRKTLMLSVDHIMAPPTERLFCQSVQLACEMIR